MAAGDTARTAYEMSCNQVLERIRLRDNALLAFLGAAGVIFGVASTDQKRANLFVMVPYLSLAAVFIVTQHDRTIGAVCTFITQDLAAYLRKLDEEAPLWEQSNALRRYTSQAMILRLLSHGILVLTPAVISLSWSWSAAQKTSLVMLAWWIGVGASAISTYLLVSTYAERTRLYDLTAWRSSDDSPVPCRSIDVPHSSVLPNVITCMRIVLAALLVWFWRSGFKFHYVAAVVTFVAAAATDLLDGHAARRLAAITRSGDLLDLFADRILAVVSVVLLAVSGLANLYLCLLVISREVAADTIRALSLHQGVCYPTTSGAGRSSLRSSSPRLPDCWDWRMVSKPRRQQ